MLTALAGMEPILVVAIFAAVVLIPLVVAYGVTVLVLRALNLRVSPRVPGALRMLAFAFCFFGALLLIYWPPIYVVGLGLSREQAYLLLFGSWVLTGTSVGTGLACKRRLTR